MDDLYEIKKVILDLLVDRMGEVNDADLFLIRKRALATGLDNQQFGLLIQEVHTSINWTKLRDEREGKDRVMGRPVNLFDQEVKSLSKLGEVLFNNRAKALRYLEDHLFLKENINYLSNQNVDLTMGFLDTYNADSDPGKRFLKIVYQLNKSLPFKVGTECFATLNDLLQKGWENYDFFEAIYDTFVAGHLQLWIKQCFPELADVLPKEQSFKDFLYFIYSFNPQYPLYIGRELFLTPEDIAVRAKKDSILWPVLIKSIQDEELFTWLERTGRSEIVVDYIEQAKFLIDREKNQHDLSCALIQKLIEIIQPDTPLPKLVVSVDRLSFLGIESKPLFHPITISLSNTGFVKATVSLDQKIEGIVIEEGYVSFFDLEGSNDITLHLNIDPLKLVKNRLYTLNFNIKTNYQSLSIPISVKTVFPLKTFSLYLLKYAFFNGTFFGFIRLLIGAANGSTNWLKPTNSPVLMWLFTGCFIGMGIGSVIACRKFQLNPKISLLAVIPTALILIFFWANAGPLYSIHPRAELQGKTDSSAIDSSVIITDPTAIAPLRKPAKQKKTKKEIPVSTCADQTTQVSLSVRSDSVKLFFRTAKIKDGEWSDWESIFIPQPGQYALSGKRGKIIANSIQYYYEVKQEATRSPGNPFTKSLCMGPLNIDTY